MRIKELASLTGTTVRAIRYYHQVGLLPVPARRDGVRDYDVAHLARVVRIRWLRQAGIPLAVIATMLDGPVPVGDGTQSVVADLRASVVALDGQLAELRDQRERIIGLIAGIERDGHLSLMPAAVVHFYDEMEAGASDEKARRAVRRERDFMELAIYRGDMPAESVLAYDGLTEARLTESLDLFTKIAERVERTDVLDDQEIDRIADGVVERLSRHLGPDLPRVLGSLDIGVARRAADLYVRLAHPRHRRLDRAIADALLTAIEKGQAQ